jgi:hypothetical protein
MEASSLMSFIKEAVSSVLSMLAFLPAALLPVKEFILGKFGWPGLVATYILLGVIGLLIIIKLLSISISAIKYVVVPSVVLALIATFFLPYSFSATLPVTVTFCSFVLLAKG